MFGKVQCASINYFFSSIVYNCIIIVAQTEGIGLRDNKLL